MKEEWIETNNTRGNSIVVIYNTGWIERKNGKKEPSTLRQKVWINGKRMKIYQAIAEHFIPKTQEDIALGRDCIDHITHYPTDMNVNDVKNLRWCNRKENQNFDEARNAQRKIQRKIQKILHEKYQLNKPKSEFGKKYYEHYGYSKSQNPKQYDRESRYYRSNGKCSWE